MFRYMFRYFLLFFMILVSFLNGSKLEIFENKNKDPYSFDKIEFNVTVPKFNYQLDRDYYLYIQKEDTKTFKKIYKFKRKEMYCIDEDSETDIDCALWEFDGSKGNKALDNNLLNLKANTEYTFFIAAEGLESDRIVENSKYTFAAPLDFELNSGFNYLELIIDKNAFNVSKADHDVLIKIKSIKDDMVYYLNDDKSLSYEPIFLNTVDLEDVNQIKDQIMPNSKYEVSITSRNKDEIRSKAITKSIKTTEIIVPDKFTIKFDQNKFIYIVNQDSKDSDVVTYLSVLDASNNEEIYSSNKISLYFLNNN